MKRIRFPFPPGSRSPFTLLIGFTALTGLILLVALPVSCVSSHRAGYLTASVAGIGTAILATRPQAAQPQLIQPLGIRPAHLRTDPVNAVPNQQAFTQALWAPGIDHGYVPQGLTFAQGQILMSGYRSRSPADSMGPCRVYRLDPESGEVTGYFDLPPACGHAGGLAYAGGGVLILSDTRRLYRLDLDLALKEKHADKAITGTLELAGALRGSFAAFVPAIAWPGSGAPDRTGTLPETTPGMFIGAWSLSARTARGYFLPLSLFDSHGGATITEADAVSSIPLAARAQGAAVAPNGSFWLSYSSHDFGRIQQVDPASGQILASYPQVSGIEDISFDELGGLWAVSEAGSLRWRSWRTSFPVVFRLDTELLESAY